MEEQLYTLAQSNTLTDLTLVECSKNGEVEHKVHKVIMYLKCPYIKTLTDCNMKDSNTSRIEIHTEPGMLDIVIKALYSPDRRLSRIYYTYCGEHNLVDIMELYNLCQYLLLDAHVEQLKHGIRDFVQPRDLVAWWKDREARGEMVPSDIDTMVHAHLKKCIKYIGSDSQSYISLDMLVQLWPTGLQEDSAIESVRSFLATLCSSIKEVSETGNDDPNSWLSEDDEEIPRLEAEPTNGNFGGHPSLHPYDEGTWINVDTQVIFVDSGDPDMGWYAIGKLHPETHLMESLTHTDRIAVRKAGWRCK